MTKQQIIDKLIEKIEYYAKATEESWMKDDKNMHTFYHGCTSALNEMLLYILRYWEEVK